MIKIVNTVNTNNHFPGSRTGIHSAFLSPKGPKESIYTVVGAQQRQTKVELKCSSGLRTRNRKEVFVHHRRFYSRWDGRWVPFYKAFKVSQLGCPTALHLEPWLYDEQVLPTKG